MESVMEQQNDNDAGINTVKTETLKDKNK